MFHLPNAFRRLKWESKLPNSNFLCLQVGPFEQNVQYRIESSMKFRESRSNEWPAPVSIVSRVIKSYFLKSDTLSLHQFFNALTWSCPGFVAHKEECRVWPSLKGILLQVVMGLLSVVACWLHWRLVLLMGKNTQVVETSCPTAVCAHCYQL